MSDFMPRYTNNNNLENDITRQGWNFQSRAKSRTVDIIQRDNIFKKEQPYISRETMSGKTIEEFITLCE